MHKKFVHIDVHKCIGEIQNIQKKKNVTKYVTKYAKYARYVNMKVTCTIRHALPLC